MEFSESRLSDRLVILAIAHRVSNDDGQAFPSVKTIAKEANVSEMAVHYSLKALVGLGELQVQEGKSKLGTNIYRLPKFLAWVQSLHPTSTKFVPPQVQNKRKGVQKRGMKSVPEPSEENHQLEPSQSLAPAAQGQSPTLTPERAREMFNSFFEEERKKKNGARFHRAEVAI